MTITVGSGATSLSFYAAAWKGAAGNISVTAPSGVTASQTSLVLSADDGISNNSPFTLSGSESDFAFTISLTGVSSGATLTFASGTARRFVVWSPSYETESGSSSSSSSSGAVQLYMSNPQYDSDNNLVTWEDVEGASYYEVSIGNELGYDEATSPYNGNFQPSVEYTVYVRACGDGVNYLTSDGKSVTFTAQAPFVGTDYVLCTSAADLVVGASYIVTSGTEGSVKAMSTESNTNNRREVAVSVNETTNKITTNSSVLVLTLGGSNGAWTFLTTNYLGTNGYLESTSEDKNYLLVKAHDSVDDIPNNGKFSISFSGDAATITANAGNKTIMRHNSSSNLFALYSSGQNNVYLWKDANAGTAQVFGELDHIKITTPASKTTFYVGETFSSAGLVLTGYDAYDESTALTEVYSSGFTTDFDGKVFSDEDIDEGITVLVTYGEKTAFYYINVSAPLEKSVAQALVIANALESGAVSTDLYKVEGYIISIVTAWSTQYHNITYTLGDTADATETIEVYRSIAANGTAGALLQVGDKVSVTGYLKNHNGTTLEFNSGCVTALLQAVPAEKIDVATALEIANALANGANSDKQYEVEGYIISIVEAWTEQYKNISYNIGDTAEATETIEVFRSNANVAQGTDGSKLKVGDKVSVVGYLTNYNGTKPEFVSGCVTTLVEASSDPKSYLDSASSVATIYGEESKNAQQEFNNSVTFSTVMSDGDVLSDENPVDIGSASLSASKGTNNNAPKYYANGTALRFYSGNILEFSVEDYYITSIEFTYSGGSYAFTLDTVDNNGSFDFDKDNLSGTWTGMSSSVSLTGTGSTRITSVSVTYGEYTTSVSSVSLRFGARFEKAIWDDMASKFTIKDYGVKLFRRSASTTNPTLTVEKAFEDGLTLATVHSGSGATPYLDTDTNEYVFNARISFSNSDYYNIVYVAAPFVVIDDGTEDGHYYFLDEMEYSVKSLAQHYVGNTAYQYLSQDALKELAK